ncbi:MAG: hypothetical protein QXT26_08760 [Thermoproteota archaeon]
MKPKRSERWKPPTRIVSIIIFANRDCGQGSALYLSGVGINMPTAGRIRIKVMMSNKALTHIFPWSAFTREKNIFIKIMDKARRSETEKIMAAWNCERPREDNKSIEEKKRKGEND